MNIEEGIKTYMCVFNLNATVGSYRFVRSFASSFISKYHMSCVILYFSFISVTLIECRNEHALNCIK